MFPCVIERWGPERGGATDQSATSSEACSVVRPVHPDVFEVRRAMPDSERGCGAVVALQEVLDADNGLQVPALLTVGVAVAALSVSRNRRFEQLSTSPDALGRPFC